MKLEYSFKWWINADNNHFGMKDCISKAVLNQVTGSIYVLLFTRPLQYLASKCRSECKSRYKVAEPSNNLSHEMIRQNYTHAQS